MQLRTQNELGAVLDATLPLQPGNRRRSRTRAEFSGVEWL
jgi:hypothetical protein